MPPMLSDQPVLSAGRSVTVEVPATSANLGPGFDCFGLALDWRERVSLAVIEQGFQIEVSGEGAAELPRDESHLIIRSALVGHVDKMETASHRPLPFRKRGFHQLRVLRVPSRQVGAIRNVHQDIFRLIVPAEDFFSLQVEVIRGQVRRLAGADFRLERGQ